MRLAAIGLGLLLASWLACFAVGTWMAARREPTARALAPSDPATRFVETRSGRVHVLEVGDGPPALLLHGTGRSVADWQEGLAERLARRHRVIGFDYYGHGLSDRRHRGRYGPRLWVDQAVDLLDALGVERAMVVGHSVGGSVASMFAADHPDRVDRVVLVGHGMAMDPSQWIPFVPGLGELAMGRTAIFSTTFSAAHRERLVAAYAVRGTRAALLTYIRRQYTVDGIRLVTGTYEEIAAPVLQVHGGEDRSIPEAAARRLSPRLRDARFVVIEGSSHDVHIDAPDRLAAEIEAFAHSSDRADGPAMRRPSPGSASARRSHDPDA